MSSERDTCRRKADDAMQRAAQATEPSIKSAYEKVAEYRMLLARVPVGNLRSEILVVQAAQNWHCQRHKDAPVPRAVQTVGIGAFEPRCNIFCKN
jgi:hypothetical protein